MTCGLSRTRHHGVSERRLAPVLASVLVMATIVAGCGTSSDDGSSETTATVAPISPAKLSDPGPYGVGTTPWSLPNGDDEPLTGVAYYPAIATGPTPAIVGEPDLTAAPYPVVLGSINMASVVGSHLASHGFVFLSLFTPLRPAFAPRPPATLAAARGE